MVYIGREYGLHPKDNWEAAEHEALMCAVEELRGVVMPVLRIKDPEASKQARTELAAAHMVKVEGNEALVCGCAGDCTCAINADDETCPQCGFEF